MNKKGYTMPELLIVLGVVSLIAIISIVKVSYAFSDINNEEEIKKIEENVITKAGIAYANTRVDELKESKVIYVSGTDLIESKFLLDEEEYKNMKFKLTYNEKNEDITVEVVK